MKSRQIYAVSAVLIVIICVIGWFFFHGSRTDITAGHENTSQSKKNNEITAENSQAQQPQQNLARNPDEESLTFEERVAQRAKSNIMSMYSEEELTTLRKQKLLAAMDSPEFREVLKNFSTRNWFDFLDSKGISTDRARAALDGAFSNNFTGSPEDYEPEMRLKIAKLFVAAGPVDLADPEAASRQRNKVFHEFSKDKRIFGWYLAQFDEDWDGIFLREGRASNPALVWMSGVQQNAARIVVNAEAASVNAAETSASAPAWRLPDTPDSSLDMAHPNEIINNDTLGLVKMIDAEIEAAIEKSLTPQHPNMPASQRPYTPDESHSNLETTLRGHFSLERFERAMSTLEQYGTEEGLRHLRENDPEVAAQVEQHRRREENSRGTIR